MILEILIKRAEIEIVDPLIRRTNKWWWDLRFFGVELNYKFLNFLMFRHVSDVAEPQKLTNSFVLTTVAHSVGYFVTWNHSNVNSKQTTRASHSSPFHFVAHNVIAHKIIINHNYSKWMQTIEGKTSMKMKRVKLLFSSCLLMNLRNFCFYSKFQKFAISDQKTLNTEEIGYFRKIRECRENCFFIAKSSELKLKLSTRGEFIKTHIMTDHAVLANENCQIFSYPPRALEKNWICES